MEAESIGVRSIVSRDLDFILATWLRSYKTGSQFASKIRSSVFFDWHQKIIKHILQQSDCRVLIAHLVSDPDVILGYLVTQKSDEAHVLHYIFVKENWRKLGIGKKLFENAQVDRAFFTHRTWLIEGFLPKYPQLVYDPYRI